MHNLCFSLDLHFSITVLIVLGFEADLSAAYAQNSALQ